MEQTHGSDAEEGTCVSYSYSLVLHHFCCDGMAKALMQLDLAASVLLIVVERVKAEANSALDASASVPIVVLRLIHNGDQHLRACDRIAEHMPASRRLLVLARAPQGADELIRYLLFNRNQIKEELELSVD